MRLLLFFGSILFWSCNTTDELPEGYLGEVVYQVQSTANNIKITYLDAEGNVKVADVTDGSWIYSFGAPINTDFELQVTSPEHYADITLEVSFAGKTMMRESCSHQDEPAYCAATGITKR